MKNQTILWIDEIAIARIEDTPRSLKLIIRDHRGSHLSVWQKESELRFEFSSNEPLGSVWDVARRGIARNLGYKSWQKHANYIANQPMGHFADSCTPLSSLAMPRDIKPARSSLLSISAVRLNSPASEYWLSLYFSPSRSTIIPKSAVFEANIGRLVISLTVAV